MTVRFDLITNDKDFTPIFTGYNLSNMPQGIIRGEIPIPHDSKANDEKSGCTQKKDGYFDETCKDFRL